MIQVTADFKINAQRNQVVAANCSNAGPFWLKDTIRRAVIVRGELCGAFDGDSLYLLLPGPPLCISTQTPLIHHAGRRSCPTVGAFVHHSTIIQRFYRKTQIFNLYWAQVYASLQCFQVPSCASTI